MQVGSTNLGATFDQIRAPSGKYKRITHISLWTIRGNSAISVGIIEFTRELPQPTSSPNLRRQGPTFNGRFVHVHTSIHMYIATYIHTLACTYAHTYVHVYVHIYK